MSSGFRNLKAEVVDRNILSTEFFAEDVAYQPVFPAPARTVRAKVSAVHLAELEDAGDEELIDRIRVLCRRDAATGIPDPQIGDLLTRSLTVDPDRRPYSYSGRKENVTDTHWALVWWRHLPVGRGPRG